MPVGIIDKDSPVPVYQQIVTDLLTRLGQEEWSVGDKLGTEGELSEYYGVSRLTVRQALSILDADGYLDRQRGRGIFVLSTPGRFTQDLQLPSLNRDRKDRAIMISRNIQLCFEPCPGKVIQRRLKLKDGTPVVALQRIFFREEIAVGINRSWFPAHLVPNLLQEGLIENSISKTLVQRYHFHVVRVENYIDATKLDASSAQLLNAPYDSAALRIESLNYDKLLAGPIEYSCTTWLSEYVRFHFTAL